MINSSTKHTDFCCQAFAKALEHVASASTINVFHDIILAQINLQAEHHFISLSFMSWLRLEQLPKFEKQWFSVHYKVL